MQRRSRRSGGFNIDRPTVSLPVSDTETGRLRFQLSSLIFHAFTARAGGGGGGKGSRCSLLFAVSSMERLFPSFVLGPQVFLPRAKGKQKTNYKDGHHVTLPTWLYIYTGNTGLVSWEEIPRWTDNLLSSLFSSIEKFLTERISRAASIIFAMIASSSLYEDFRLISSLCFESKSEGYY